MRTFLAAATLAVTATAAMAEYPEKPVSFVVSWPPGDLEDVLTRMIADEFQAMYGVPAAVVNKPGGGGGPFPGAVDVATAPADGYTVGSFVTDVPICGPEIGIPELSPNPFEPIGIFMTYPFVIVSGKDVPADAREKIATAAQKALTSEKAQNLISETGVLTYWQTAEESLAQIETDTATISEITKILGE